MKYLYVSTIFLLTLTCLSLSFSLQAQWTGDVANHTLIAEGTPHSQRPKVVKTSDGKTFIAWIEGDTIAELGLVMRLQLQLLDFEGHTLWEQGGITVAEHYKATWINNYILQLDNDDNAIVVFSGEKNALDSNDLSAYKISQTGEQLWGEEGIYFDTPDANEGAPVCKINEDNELFIAVNQEIDANELPRCQIYKIASSGTMMWGEEGVKLFVINITSTIFKVSGLQTQSDGGVTLLCQEIWSLYNGSRVYVQRFNSDGTTTGNTPNLITTTNHTRVVTYGSSWGFFAGENGDMYIGWGVITELGNYGENTVTMHVQRIDAEGERLWGDEGIALRTIDTDTPELYQGTFQEEIAFAGLNDVGDLIIFWKNCYGWCDAFAIGSEAITPEGTRLWGTGEEIAEIASFGDYYTYMINIGKICEGNAFAFHTLPDGNNAEFQIYHSDFYGRKVDAYTGQGAQLLPLAVNDTVSFYYHQMSEFVEEQAVTVFLEYPSRSIKAQAITCDGELANFVGIEDDKPGNQFSNWQIFPNPATDKTQISWDNQATVEQVLVYNSIGQQVQMHDLIPTNHAFELSLEALQTGIYWVVLETEEGSVSKKVVKY